MSEIDLRYGGALEESSQKLVVDELDGDRISECGDLHARRCAEETAAEGDLYAQEIDH